MNEETIEIPRKRLAMHVLPLAFEGNVEWNVNDEVKDKVSYKDFLNPYNVTHAENNDDRLLVVSEVESSVSERVSRATHWHPAEYKNHDVTVFCEAVLEWPDDDDGYQLPQTLCRIEQGSYPTEPPVPAYDPMEHA